MQNSGIPHNEFPHEFLSRKNQKTTDGQESSIIN